MLGCRDNVWLFKQLRGNNCIFYERIMKSDSITLKLLTKWRRITCSSYNGALVLLLLRAFSLRNLIHRLDYVYGPRHGCPYCYDLTSVGVEVLSLGGGLHRRHTAVVIRFRKDNDSWEPFIKWPDKARGCKLQNLDYPNWKLLAIVRFSLSSSTRILVITFLV